MSSALGPGVGTLENVYTASPRFPLLIPLFLNKWIKLCSKNMFFFLYDLFIINPPNLFSSKIDQINFLSFLVNTHRLICSHGKFKNIVLIFIYFFTTYPCKYCYSLWCFHDPNILLTHKKVESLYIY